MKKNKIFAILASSLLFLSVGTAVVWPKAFAEENTTEAIKEEHVKKQEQSTENTIKEPNKPVEETVSPKKEKLPIGNPTEKVLQPTENQQIKKQENTRGSFTPYAFTEGLKVVQDPDTKPSLNLSYGRGTDSDYWKGKIQVDWRNKATITLQDPPKFNINIIKWAADWLKYLQGMFQNGLAFKAVITLPDGFNAKDVADSFYANGNKPVLEVTGDKPSGLIASLINAIAELIGGGKSTIDVEPSQLEPIDANHLSLSFRKDNSGGFLGSLVNVAVNTLYSLMNGKPVSISLTGMIDVPTAAKSGHPQDFSPEKILTKGKMPPSKDKKITLGVNFYDANDINDDFSVVAGHENNNYAEASVATWNSYISPWDNESKYNTELDTIPEVTDANKTLPGSINNRQLYLDYLKDGRFDQFSADRFNRVVNFFDHTNVTSEAALSHTPTKLPAFNKETSVVYTGTQSDAYGKNTPLSPVNLKVTEHYEAMVLRLKENKKYYLANSDIETNLSWLGKMNKNATFYYKIDNGAYVKDPTIQNNEPMNQNHDLTLAMPKIKTLGKHTITVYAIDENNMKSNEVSYDIQILNAVPEIGMDQTLTDLSSKETGTTIGATVGETIEDQTIVKNTGNGSALNGSIKIKLPDNTTFVPDSMHVKLALAENNGTIIDLPITGKNVVNGELNLNLNDDLDLGAKGFTPNSILTITYAYTIDTITKDSKIPVSPEQFIGDIAGVAEKQQLLGQSNEAFINAKSGEIRFIDVPKEIDYKTSKVPIINQTISRVNDPFAIDILDTQSNPDWTLTVRQTSPFVNGENQTLPGNLIFKSLDFGTKDIGTSSVAIYQNKTLNHGEKHLAWDEGQGLLLNVLGNQRISTASPYKTDLIWTINMAPSN